MKRIIAILLIALTAFSCSKDEKEEYAECTFTAGICPDTKALVDDGKGDNVNRCVLEVYRGSTLYDRIISPVTDKTASFTTTLIKNKTYTLVFWADCGNISDLTDLYYNTEDHLTAVSFKGTYHGSNDAMDAFCGTQQFTADGDPTPAVSLTRPFAQVNTTNDNYSGAGAAVQFTAPQSYNVKDDELGTAGSFSYENTALYSSSPKVLSMDYIFTSEAGTKISLTVAGTALNDIPIKRNTRTNVSFQ